MFKCKHCNKEFDSKQKLGGHVRQCKMNPDFEKYNRPSIGKYVCKFCGKELKTSQALGAHLTMHNDSKNKSNWNQQILCYCKFCNKELQSINSLKNHERLCKNNPKRQETYLQKNGYTSIGHAAWNKGLTKDTDDRVKKNGEGVKTAFVEGRLAPPPPSKELSEKISKTILEKAKNRRMAYVHNQKRRMRI